MKDHDRPDTTIERFSEGTSITIADKSYTIGEHLGGGGVSRCYLLTDVDNIPHVLKVPRPSEDNAIPGVSPTQCLEIVNGHGTWEEKRSSLTALQSTHPDLKTVTANALEYLVTQAFVGTAVESRVAITRALDVSPGGQMYQVQEYAYPDKLEDMRKHEWSNVQIELALYQLAQVMNVAHQRNVTFADFSAYEGEKGDRLRVKLDDHGNPHLKIIDWNVSDQGQSGMGKDIVNVGYHILKIFGCDKPIGPETKRSLRDLANLNTDSMSPAIAALAKQCISGGITTAQDIEHHLRLITQFHSLNYDNEDEVNLFKSTFRTRLERIMSGQGGSVVDIELAEEVRDSPLPIDSGSILNRLLQNIDTARDGIMNKDFRYQYAQADIDLETGQNDNNTLAKFMRLENEVSDPRSKIAAKVKIGRLIAEIRVLLLEMKRGSPVLQSLLMIDEMAKSLLDGKGTSDEGISKCDEFERFVSQDESAQKIKGYIGEMRSFFQAQAAHNQLQSCIGELKGIPHVSHDELRELRLSVYRTTGKPCDTESDLAMAISNPAHRQALMSDEHLPKPLRDKIQKLDTMTAQTSATRDTLIRSFGLTQQLTEYGWAYYDKPQTNTDLERIGKLFSIEAIATDQIAILKDRVEELERVLRERDNEDTSPVAIAAELGRATATIEGLAAKVQALDTENVSLQRQLAQAESDAKALVAARVSLQAESVPVVSDEMVTQFKEQIAQLTVELERKRAEVDQATVRISAAETMTRQAQERNALLEQTITGYTLRQETNAGQLREMQDDIRAKASKIRQQQDEIAQLKAQLSQQVDHKQSGPEVKTSSDLQMNVNTILSLLSEGIQVAEIYREYMRQDSSREEEIQKMLFEAWLTAQGKKKIYDNNTERLRQLKSLSDSMARVPEAQQRTSPTYAINRAEFEGLGGDWEFNNLPDRIAEIEGDFKRLLPSA